ncbi:hypothetical protein PFISCL1PPCAC_3110, partial [Pristionchus fissidentatus]
SNLIIMKFGQIVVEGTPQSIRSQFGEHYNLNLTMEGTVDMDTITSTVVSVFKDATLYESASVRNIKYKIPRLADDVFSDLFEMASKLSVDLKSSDFCFTQATLEDAFILAAGGNVGVNPGGQLPAGKHQLEKKTDRKSPVPSVSTASNTNKQ